jgi:transposase InsO family protein
MGFPIPVANAARCRFLPGVRASPGVPAKRSSCQGMFGGTSATLYGRPAANVLDREFVAAAPNQRWVADFTYLWTNEGWLYVAVVLDLYSRLVVGWSMQSSMTAQLVSDAMLMAIWRRRPAAELPHHSDQGSQYSSDQFQQLLAEHGVVCSISWSGNCWDNAAMESFFSTMKTERTSRKSTGHGTKLGQMCSITSNGSTISVGGTRHWVT